MKAALDECTLERVYVEASSARSRSAIERACSMFVREHGLDRFLLVWATPRRGPAASRLFRSTWQLDDCHNLPVALVDQLADCIHPDPVLQRFLSGDWRAQAWDEAHYVDAGAALRWQRMAEAGLSRGLSVGLPAAQGQVLVFSVGLPGCGSAPEGLAQDMSLFASMVSEPVRRYLSLDDEDLVPALQPEHRLTGRELRLLSLAATAPTLQSMTRTEPMSLSAIEKSLANVRRKLGSRSTAEAVIKALHFGLLNTSDLLKTGVS